MSNNGNGWDTYSKLVLQQLETMANGIDALRTELQDVKSQLTELKAKEDRVQDLKAWKEKMDDVASMNRTANADSLALIVQGTLIFLSAVVAVVGYFIQGQLRKKERRLLFLEEMDQAKAL